jgi:hypothetical protein
MARLAVNTPASVPCPYKGCRDKIQVPMHIVTADKPNSVTWTAEAGFVANYTMTVTPDITALWAHAEMHAAEAYE